VDTLRQDIALCATIAALVATATHDAEVRALAERTLAWALAQVDATPAPPPPYLPGAGDDDYTWQAVADNAGSI
jgi:hypothetical protein